MPVITVEFDVPAPMRDGVVLRANIFRPADGGPYPIALTRTPYGKDFASASPILDAVRLARAGYIVVIQDVRGRFRSDGDWREFRAEAQDGYDSVEWAAGLPGSSGAVGMFGASYYGFTQWAAAREQPPHLKALMPTVTWSDARDGVTWRGGALELGTFAHWYLSALALDVVLKRHAGAALLERIQAVKTAVGEIDRLRAEGYYSLPLREFEPLARVGVGYSSLQEALAEPYSRSHNEPYSVREAYERIRVPAHNVGGWYDIFTNGTLQNFAALRSAGSTPEARQSRLLMGPWSHVNYSQAVGEVDFGFAAQLALMNLQTDLTGLTQRWFDFWLKGIQNGVNQEPPVRLFIMGDNTWRDEHEWPLARTRYTPYYLRAGGVLSTARPDGEAPDRYTYDPADPTPTLGGNILMNPLFGPGARDQRPIEARGDVVGYSGEPLAADTEVTGPIHVRLWACSDAPDTDFVARLVDVHPDGFAQNVADGIIRARYRHGETPELLEPGRPYEFDIDLWATANVFRRGHRIRLDIASACFPRWDRNPNTGAPIGADAVMRPARQTILHDAEHPSHVLLPIIPRQG